MKAIGLVAVLALLASDPALAARKKKARKGRASRPAASAPAPARATPAPPSVRQGVEYWRAGKWDQAVNTWTPFAEAGDLDAMFNLGQAYKLGRGVPLDKAIARDWYRRAAVKGHLPAQANLGILLFQAGDKAEGVRWLKAAADRGEMRAQYVLGIVHWNGDGAGKSMPLAYAYLVRSAAQGLPEATRALNELSQAIQPLDRANGWQIATALANGSGVPAQFQSAIAPPPMTPVTGAPAPVVMASAANAGQDAPAAQAGAMASAGSTTTADLNERALRMVEAGTAPAGQPVPQAQTQPSPPSPPPSALSQPAAQAQAVPPAEPGLPPMIAARPEPPAAQPAPPAPQSMASPPLRSAISPAVERAPRMAEKPPAKPVKAKAPPPPRETGWRIQLGTYPNQKSAMQAWTKLAAANKKATRGIHPTIGRINGSWRLQVGPFETREAANKGCGTLEIGKNGCFALNID